MSKGHIQPDADIDSIWPRPQETRWKRGLDWMNVGWIGVLHLLALSAPFLYSWQGLTTFLVWWWITGSLGICLGFHRLITHGSFRTFRPVYWLFAWLGGLAGEGPAITWVATHRKHHSFSDKDGDPHSPREGGWWSHMLWLGPHMGREIHDKLVGKYAPDLAKDRVLRFLDSTFLLWHFVVGIAMFCVGYFAWGTYVGLSMVAWGMFLRLVWVLHVTWFVNSASHMWGYRNYATTDDSRNLWWVGLVAFGEGWHNNHHAFQRMARHGHRWWEIDMTYWTVFLMEKLGLAWDVVKDPPKHGRPK